MAETIKLKSDAPDGFEFTALHAQAEGKRRGGIVIIQEIFGLDKYVQEDVARWAQLGFEALAPSMFDRQEPGFTAGHDPEGMQAGFKHAMANGIDNAIRDVQACVDFLKPHGPVFIDGLEAQSLTFRQYGYFVMDRGPSGWTGVFKDIDGKAVARCTLVGRRLSCGRA